MKEDEFIEVAKYFPPPTIEITKVEGGFGLRHKTCESCKWWKLLPPSKLGKCEFIKPQMTKDFYCSLWEGK
jgi:hypothetical protein